MDMEAYEKEMFALGYMRKMADGEKSIADVLSNAAWYGAGALTLGAAGGGYLSGYIRARLGAKTPEDIERLKQRQAVEFMAVKTKELQEDIKNRKAIAAMSATAEEPQL
jgi:hypothetical protein